MSFLVGEEERLEQERLEARGREAGEKGARDLLTSLPVFLTSSRLTSSLPFFLSSSSL
jgi:hypothetical protein